MLAGLHVAVFGILLLLVVPRHFDLGDGAVFGLGLGITAYTLGLRHAFDADHIASIDNTTRKLMGDSQRRFASASSSRSATRRIVFALAFLFVDWRAGA